MSLTRQEVAFLQRLCAEQKPHRGAGVVARFLAHAHSIGTLSGNSVFYVERDFTAAANLLTSRSHDLQAQASGHSRSEAAPGGSEKDGAAPVGGDLIAIVALHMGVSMPAGVRFLAADWREVDLASFEVILEVENLETLPQLASYSWLSRFVGGRRTMAVFRGKPHSFNTGAAARFIRGAGKPVLGFYDFDPAGLMMAATEPHLEHLCLPPWPQLVAATRRYRRTHLYLDQVQGARARLESLPQGPVREAWLQMKALQCGLPQENFPR